ncbi:FkbM family methyltransferase [Dyella psychrodurans]|uniref:FkbM family methyltransferase n=1 Tax=Dyella psychrodurans TaxID=1927960 RepID=A0A370XBW1_9GAMM|nr:FkbM family methyltransferase [Dyella psychrodurans]RDS85760.1 FkbM family methyltransferase [Dyella psychrodurans]
MNIQVNTSEQTSRLWNTRYGLMTAVKADTPAARSLQLYGEWAEQEINLLSGLIQDGQSVMEFGGEYGAHALWLARAVGEKGQVHVAEPRRIPFQQLCANIAINQLTNVYTHLNWLGRSTGPSSLASLPHNATLKHAQDEIVNITTVDGLGLEALHLLKINVPGSLLELLAGATETIRKHRPFLYYRLAGIEQVEAEIQAIKDLGYRCWSHVPYLYNADNHAEQTSNIFPGCVHQNVIASPVEGRFELERRYEL